MDFEQLNVYFLGDKGVGKSSILQTFAAHGLFVTGESGKTADPVFLDGYADARVNVRLTDGGHSLNSQMRRDIREKADGLVIVCSWDIPESVTRALEHWLPEIVKTWMDPVPITVLVNKSDRRADDWGLSGTAVMFDYEGVVRQIRSEALITSVYDDCSARYQPSRLFRILEEVCDSVVFPRQPLLVTSEDYKFRSSLSLTAHYRSELHSERQGSLAQPMRRSLSSSRSTPVLYRYSASRSTLIPIEEETSHSAMSSDGSGSSSGGSGGGSAVMTEGLLFALRRIFHVLDSTNDGLCDCLLTDDDLNLYFNEQLQLKVDQKWISEMKQRLREMDERVLREEQDLQNEHSKVGSVTELREDSPMHSDDEEMGLLGGDHDTPTASSPLCLALGKGVYPQKSVLKITDYQLTLYGFLRLHDLLISDGQMVAIWSALESFGYSRRRLQLKSCLIESIRDDTRLELYSSQTSNENRENHRDETGSMMKKMRDGSSQIAQCYRNYSCEMKVELMRRLMQMFINNCVMDHIPHDGDHCCIDRERMTQLLEMYNLSSLPFGSGYLRMTQPGYGVAVVCDEQRPLSSEKISLSSWLSMWNLSMHVSPKETIGLLVYGMGVAPLHVSLLPQMSDFVSVHLLRGNLSKKQIMGDPIKYPVHSPNQRFLNVLVLTMDDLMPQLSLNGKLQSYVRRRLKKSHNSNNDNNNDHTDDDNGMILEGSQQALPMPNGVDDRNNEEESGFGLDICSHFLSSFIHEFDAVRQSRVAWESLSRALSIHCANKSSAHHHLRHQSIAGHDTSVPQESDSSLFSDLPSIEEAMYDCECVRRDECVGSVPLIMSEDATIETCDVFSVRMVTAHSWFRFIPKPEHVVAAADEPNPRRLSSVKSRSMSADFGERRKSSSLLGSLETGIKDTGSFSQTMGGEERGFGGIIGESLSDSLSGEAGRKPAMGGLFAQMKQHLTEKNDDTTVDSDHPILTDAQIKRCFSDVIRRFDSVLFLCPIQNQSEERMNQFTAEQKNYVAMLSEACVDTLTPLMPIVCEMKRKRMADDNGGNDEKSMEKAANDSVPFENYHISGNGHRKYLLKWTMLEDVSDDDSDSIMNDQIRFNRSLSWELISRKQCIPLSMWDTIGRYAKPLFILAAGVGSAYCIGKLAMSNQWMWNKNNTKRRKKRKVRRKKRKKNQSSQIQSDSPVQSEMVSPNNTEAVSVVENGLDGLGWSDLITVVSYLMNSDL